jgi:hypothetical protein
MIFSDEDVDSMGEAEQKKISEYEFFVRAICRLRTPPYKCIHSVYTGFNQAYREYFNKDPIEAAKRLSEEGKIFTRPVKGGALLYLPEDRLLSRRSKSALARILQPFESTYDKKPKGVEEVTKPTRYGWKSAFPAFKDTDSKTVITSLKSFISDASPEQIRAWKDSIPKLQKEVDEILRHDDQAKRYSIVLEYELPMESRRPDAVFLINGAVVALECKGKLVPSQADIDQAAAYARDLRCYHKECASLPVYPVVVATRAEGYISNDNGVYVVGADVLGELVDKLERERTVTPISAEAFLSEAAYRPLPTIVQAARELMHSGTIRPIHRARAATEPTLNEISKIIHEAARTRSRRLILVTGVPGAGKTLVGLQAVHAHFLDDISVPREDGKPTAPAVFLSGNGPLVQVLQYELKDAGGGGRTFVRGVKDYVKTYSRRSDLVPPEHVLVFDEAQRAFDAEQVRQKHANTPGYGGGKSEPEHFVEFAERIPEWCVVIGLIGTGQEIHVGEEAGLIQWRHAIEGSRNPSDWTVYAPALDSDVFAESGVKRVVSESLGLNTEIRFHMASDLHMFVEELLEGKPAEGNAMIAAKLENEGYHLRITRDLRIAKEYMRNRYAENQHARFGLIASSKDRDLWKFEIHNDFQSTRRINFGPWYSDSEEDPGRQSCRRLELVVTEFGAQGLELDAALVAWGTDLMMTPNGWSNAKARGYAKYARVKDPFQLRLNAYRVLLTRGRDASIVFVPGLSDLTQTFEYLMESGFRVLG